MPLASILEASAVGLLFSFQQHDQVNIQLVRLEEVCRSCRHRQDRAYAWQTSIRSPRLRIGPIFIDRFLTLVVDDASPIEASVDPGQRERVAASPAALLADNVVICVLRAISAVVPPEIDSTAIRTPVKQYPLPHGCVW